VGILRLGLGPLGILRLGPMPVGILKQGLGPWAFKEWGRALGHCLRLGTELLGIL